MISQVNLFSESIAKLFYVYLINSPTITDCSGANSFQRDAFHFELEHSLTHGALQSMRLKQGHVFDVGQLQLLVHPVVCHKDAGQLLLSDSSLSHVKRTHIFGIGDTMLTCPCNVDPLSSHFYIVKLGFTRVYIFLIFALKHRLWVLVRTASLRRF